MAFSYEGGTPVGFRISGFIFSCFVLRDAVGRRAVHLHSDFGVRISCTSVHNLGFGVLNLGFRVSCLVLRVSGFELGFRVSGFRFRV